MEFVGRLAGGVAHDFNNMLNVILGNVELALDEENKTQLPYSNLLEIRSAARRSANFTRQLLAFSRQQIIAPRPLNLNDVVSDMLKMLHRLIGEDIDLVWIPEENLGQVNLDPTQIDQILANLCVNARDALPGVGTITIETQNVTFDNEYCVDHPDFYPGSYVMLAVSDNGCGMDQETKAKIFEPFFTTKRVGQGTGLGLSTVCGIIKQNSGFINVYSELGRGTTFKIYLRRHEAKEKARKVEEVTPILQGGSETILFVEDEVMILELGRKMLENLGYQILCANSPIEALNLAKKHEGGHYRPAYNRRGNAGNER